MRFLFIEPFYGGSHKVFTDGWINNSKYRIDLVSLKAEKFKWRIRASAYYFRNLISDIYQYDGLIVTDMINLSDFKSFFKKNIPPVLFYFHENQLDYPLASNQKSDYHLIFSNISSAVSADLLYFNSYAHKNSFIDSAKSVLRTMPLEDGDLSILDEINSKAEVLYPGCDFKFLGKSKKKNNKIPHILWNHRWSYDKKPEVFFNVLSDIKKAGFDFRLIILGEKEAKKNKIFSEAQIKFKNEIVHFGYAEDKTDYYNLLLRSDIVISASIQENFGYSVVEAVRAGCIPLLPGRLSYPEIIPAQFHDQVLYKDYGDLFRRLSFMLSGSGQKNETFIKKLSDAMNTYSWYNIIKDYDRALEKLADLS